MSTQLTYVKPASVSKFWHNTDVKGYSNFPETTKAFPILWSFDLHKFVFKDLSDDQVMELVTKCKLSYELGEDEGKPILTADITHQQDPFFNHSQLTLKIKNDISTFNLNNPLDVLKLAAFKAYPFVAQSHSGKDTVAGAKWVVIDAKTEQEDLETKHVRQKEIWKYFTDGSKDKLTPAQMRSLINAFQDRNMRIEPNTPAETLEAILIQKINDPSVRSGLTPRELFLKLVKLPKNELIVRDFIGQAINLGVIRRTGDKYFYGGNEIATGMENLIKTLQSIDYVTTYTAIQEELKLKS